MNNEVDPILVGEVEDIEVGTVEDFEHEDIETALRTCQRYYQIGSYRNRPFGDDTGSGFGDDTGGDDAGGFGESFRGDEDTIDRLLLEGKRKNEDIFMMTEGIENLINSEDSEILTD